MRMLLAATLLVSAHATAPSPEPFTVTEVAPGVFAAVASTAEDSPHGNGGFVVGSEAVLVVDSFATAEAAERLIAEVRARTSLPIRFAVLTHFHSDHTGGSAAYAKAGAAVLAHENVRAWVRREWQTDLASEQKSRYAALRLPDVTFRDRVSIDLGGRMRIVDAVHQPGHSGSDSLVLVPDAKVVFTGDLFSKRCIPGTTFARTDAWIATLDDLLRAYPDWTFVPGHGETGKALDVRSFRDYLTGLRQAVARALYDGKSGAALLEAVKAQMAVRYKSWAGFEEIGRNIADTERELTGTKAYPPAPPG